MSTRRKRGNRQPELFARSTKPVIAIEMNHRLVRLTHELDWTELEEIVEEIRARKLTRAPSDRGREKVDDAIQVSEGKNQILRRLSEDGLVR